MLSLDKTHTVSRFWKDFSKNVMLRYAPLGKKLSRNFYSLVLINKMRPVKLGEVGELFIGGQNVGLGYLNDNKTTAEKFIQNPINKFHKDIIYKSGDLVYVDPKTKYIYYSSQITIKHMPLNDQRRCSSGRYGFTRRGCWKVLSWPHLSHQR